MDDESKKWGAYRGLCIFRLKYGLRRSEELGNEGLYFNTCGCWADGVQLTLRIGLWIEMCGSHAAKPPVGKEPSCF